MERLRGRHVPVVVTTEPLVERLPHAVWAFESPVGRTETFQALELARAKADADNQQHDGSSARAELERVRADAHDKQQRINEEHAVRATVLQSLETDYVDYRRVLNDLRRPVIAQPAAARKSRTKLIAHSDRRTAAAADGRVRGECDQVARVHAPRRAHVQTQSLDLAFRVAELLRAS